MKTRRILDRRTKKTKHIALRARGELLLGNGPLERSWCGTEPGPNDCLVMAAGRSNCVNCKGRRAEAIAKN